jgi:Flp pilus assembly protein TadG
MMLVWGIVVIMALMAIVSLGVDLGRAQLARTELQQAADAAARHAATGLKNVLRGRSAAFDNAAAAAAQNYADGTPILLDTSQDVELGIWDAQQRTFTRTNSVPQANAVRVTARRTAARNNAVGLVFSRLAGKNSVDVSASAIATLAAGEEETLLVSAKSNPFLAGMPPGSMASRNNPHNSPDYAGTPGNPRQSPRQASLPIVAGSVMTFDGVNGGANNDPGSATRFTADGNTSSVGSNTNGAENGISDLRAPLNSLVGVFLGDDRPDQTSAPARLSFDTAPLRNFTSLEPQLKQTFFIGDGRSDAGEVQQFKVPPGATRLFIATWDTYEWNNNVGSFSITVHRPGQIALVK